MDKQNKLALILKFEGMECRVKDRPMDVAKSLAVHVSFCCKAFWYGGIDAALQRLVITFWHISFFPV